MEIIGLGFVIAAMVIWWVVLPHTVGAVLFISLVHLSGYSHDMLAYGYAALIVFGLMMDTAAIYHYYK